MYAHPHVKSSGLKDKPTIENSEPVKAASADPVEEGKVESHTRVLSSK